MIFQLIEKIFFFGYNLGKLINKKGDHFKCLVMTEFFVKYIFRVTHKLFDQQDL